LLSSCTNTVQSTAYWLFYIVIRFWSAELQHTSYCSCKVRTLPDRGCR
jgi:hypothetical protein